MLPVVPAPPLRLIPGADGNKQARHAGPCAAAPRTIGPQGRHCVMGVWGDEELGLAAGGGGHLRRGWEEVAWVVGGRRWASQQVIGGLGSGVEGGGLGS